MKKLSLTTLLLLSINFFWSQGDLLTDNLNNQLYSSNVETTVVSSFNSPLNERTISIDREIFNSELLKERLKVLDERTPFNVPYNATVERFIRVYLKTRKDDFSNLMDKAKYYFPIFEEYLDKYDLPLEIKYLAIVESALEPNARSASGAKGLWQFMYQTGKQFNLNITSYVDERTDPIKATQAACQYLKSLHTTFKDWDLALAAYNSGPGNVSKAIRRSGGLRNYWNIRRYLPAETRSYLPTFYATLYLFEYGKDHQIYPKNNEITYHEIDTILVKSKITFKEIRERFNIDDKLLRFLNPQYRLGIIPFSKQRKHYLTLPKSMIGRFVSNESEIYKLARDNAQIEPLKFYTPNDTNSYTVQSNENLSTISQKFNITISQLKNWNGLQTNYVVEGQRLVITNKKNSNFKSTTSLAYNDEEFNTYVVKEGDSLWRISKLFPDTTITQLKSWNNLWGISFLKPGTTLKILTK